MADSNNPNEITKEKYDELLNKYSELEKKNNEFQNTIEKKQKAIIEIDKKLKEVKQNNKTIENPTITNNSNLSIDEIEKLINKNTEAKIQELFYFQKNNIEGKTLDKLNEFCNERKIDFKNRSNYEKDLIIKEFNTHTNSNSKSSNNQVTPTIDTNKGIDSSSKSGKYLNDEQQDNLLASIKKQFETN